MVTTLTTRSSGSPPSRLHDSEGSALFPLLSIRKEEALSAEPAAGHESGAFSVLGVGHDLNIGVIVDQCDRVIDGWFAKDELAEDRLFAGPALAVKADTPRGKATAASRG